MNHGSWSRCDDYPRAKKYAMFVLGVTTKLGFMFFAGLAVVAVLLLMVGKTYQTVFFAVGVFAASSLAMYLIACLAYLRVPRQRVLVLSLVTVAFAALSICVSKAPTMRTAASSELQSIYLQSVPLAGLSPTALVPESDQVRLGSFLVPIIDPYSDFAQGARFRQAFSAVYAELQASQEFNQVGSVLGDAYCEMFFGYRRLNHCYVYYPKASSGKRPAVIFLHGWLGNMKCYIWLWSKFAERNGYIIVCPTFGNGRWQKSGSEEKLRETLKFCREDSRIDSDRIYVAGMSNGGMGVTRVALEFPEYVQGLIYLSPVLESTKIGSDEFRRSIGRKPILVIYGGKDNRVPRTFVSACLDEMRKKELNVESKCYEEEEHLLFITESESVMTDIELWLQTSSTIHENDR